MDKRTSIKDLTSEEVKDLQFIPWPAIHIIGAGDGDGTVIYHFFYALINLLPNKKIRDRSWEFMEQYPLENYITSNDRIFQWTYLWHDFMEHGIDSPTLQKLKERYSEFDKRRWGNAFWQMIHTIGRHLPANPNKDVKIMFLQFIDCIQQLLPCPKCQKHMAGHMKRYPLEKYMQNRDYIFAWTVTLHNVVNQSLGKKLVSIEDAYMIY